ncbi:reverse transcriptase domain-containing protein [Tanacetum coccineum]|uniref:Reverse transcriptase domain-containing protein n=1 Tax=Tanacetum coccineum TaxID=301880 RepID=A0ABQ5J9Z0_9ASTR
MNEFMAKHEPWSRWDGSRVMASRSVLEPVVWSPGGCWSRGLYFVALMCEWTTASMGIKLMLAMIIRVVDVTSSQPATIDHAVHMAYQLMGQIIQDKADEVHEGEKRKGEGDRGGRSDNRRDYNNRQNQRRANVGAMTNVVANDNEVYLKWKMQDTKHNGDAGSTQDPKVVTGTFLLNNRYATALFDSGADKSFVSTNFSTLIDIKPVELDTSYEVELVDGKV